MTDKLSGLVLQKGARALLQGRPVVIEAIVDLDLVRVRDLTTANGRMSRPSPSAGKHETAPN